MAGAQQRRGEHLSPDEIVTRAFPSAFRGISEPEVRAYLRRVADELRALRDREASLSARVTELEHNAANPTPPTEQELLDSLGEETARVLRSAQQAAEEIRNRAEERAASLVKEATANAKAMRDEAASILEERTRAAEEAASELRRRGEETSQAMIADAEARVAALTGDAEAFATKTRDEATQQAEALLEHARNEGRHMVAEARDVRERVLKDLARRRDALHEQIEELRGRRAQVVDAFRTVKHAYTEAVQALTRSDREVAAVTASGDDDVAAMIAAATMPTAGASAEPTDSTEPTEAAEPTEPTEAVAELVTAEGGAPEREPVTAAATAPTAQSETDAVAVDQSEPSEGGSEGEGEGVEAIFAKLRAEREQQVAQAREVLHETAADLDLTTIERGTEEGADSETAPAVDDAEPLEGDAAILAARDERVGELAVDVARGVKRRLQDEQNEVLDLIRRQKKKIVIEKSLPELDDQADAWIEVLSGSVRAAFVAGARSVDESAAVAIDDDAVRDVAQRMFEPLRERLVATISESIAPGVDLDTSDLPGRIGARYREWRNQDLDVSIDEALCGAYARGVMAAVPAGSALRWIPAAGGCCPDCDDNSLEPTVCGEAFPSGQVAPPAHSGCRCVITPAAAETATAVTATQSNEA